jgi:hypothetical protein
MSKITITLTTDQATAVVRALELDQNPDYPKSDKLNAFLQRIINKINAELI